MREIISLYKGMIEDLEALGYNPIAKGNNIILVEQTELIKFNPYGLCRLEV